jgi:hypothetical protein
VGCIHGKSLILFTPAPFVADRPQDDDIEKWDKSISGDIDLYDNFDDMDIEQEIYTSQHPEVAKWSELYHAGTEVRRGNAKSIGTVSIKGVDWKEMGFKIRDSKRGRGRFIRTQYRIDIIHEGMVSKLRMYIPKGGKFPDTKFFECGEGALVQDFYLRDLAPHDVRENDNEVEMTGIGDGGEGGVKSGQETGDVESESDDEPILGSQRRMRAV